MWHWVQENTKGMSQAEISDWAKKHGIALKNLDKARAATNTAHTAAENKVRKSTPSMVLDAKAHKTGLNTLNGTRAATNTTHAATENGKKKATPTLSAEARDLKDKIGGLHNTKAATSTAHHAAENGVPKHTPTMSAEARDLKDKLAGGGGLNGTSAAASAAVSSYENGGQMGLSDIDAHISDLVTQLDALNNKKAYATLQFDLVDNVTGQLTMSLAAAEHKIAAAQAKGAEGGYFTKPTNMLIGEAGPEVLLPLRDQARSMQLLTRYAPELIRGPDALDTAVLRPKGSKSTTATTNGPVTGLNIENAVFQDGTDADLVAARMRSSLRLLGVT
jgi:hypothetical protein